MDKSKLVITIERQYGSGGRIVGKKLAEELGISFYDDEILSMTAEKSALGEKYFRLADEKAGNNLLRKIVGNLRFPVGIFEEPKKEGDVTSPDNLFRFQAEVIRELASEESCVIVGRCADYILETSGKTDLVKIFVYADLSTCVRRTQETDGISDTKEALNKLNRITKQRKSYHKYFTGKEWEDVTNYDLPINASKLELDQVVELIKDYIRMIGYDIWMAHSRAKKTVTEWRPFLRCAPRGARFHDRELLFGDFYSLDLFVVDRTVILDLKGITLSVLAEIDAVGYEREEVTGLCFQNDVITVFTKLCNLADKCVDLGFVSILCVIHNDLDG